MLVNMLKLVSNVFSVNSKVNLSRHLANFAGKSFFKRLNDKQKPVESRSRQSGIRNQRETFRQNGRDDFKEGPRNSSNYSKQRFVNKDHFKQNYNKQSKSDPGIRKQLKLYGQDVDDDFGEEDLDQELDVFKALFQSQ